MYRVRGRLDKTCLWKRFICEKNRPLAALGMTPGGRWVAVDQKADPSPARRDRDDVVCWFSHSLALLRNLSFCQGQYPFGYGLLGMTFGRNARISNSFTPSQLLRAKQSGTGVPPVSGLTRRHGRDAGATHYWANSRRIFSSDFFMVFIVFLFHSNLLSVVDPQSEGLRAFIRP